MPVDLLANKLDWPTLAFLILFIVFPGLVTMRVFRLFAAAKEMDWRFSLHESAFWGTVNILFAYLIWTIFVIVAPYLYKPSEILAEIDPLNRFVESFVFLIVTAMILSAVWLFFRKREFVKRYILCQDPTAWDYYFSYRQPCFILVHLKNGSLIGGYFGSRSFASAYPDKRSLFIEKVIQIDENGNFGSYVENSDGVLLREDDFEYLEFFSISDNSILQNENQKETKNVEPTE